jgi:hypothetical protein
LFCWERPVLILMDDEKPAGIGPLPEAAFL